VTGRLRGRTLAASLLGTLALLAGCAGGTAPAPVESIPDEYVAEIEEWRAGRVERLQSETGWLTVVGLHWLTPGTSTFGTDPDGTIVFPAGSAPAKVGTLTYRDGKVTVAAEPGAGLMLEAEDGNTPVDTMELSPDTAENTDVLRVNDLSFYVIERAGRYGIRVRDPNSSQRTGFSGLDWYDIDLAGRVEATFVPYDEPKEVTIDTVIDAPTTMQAPGYVELDLAGEAVQLEPLLSGERYWFIFRDATNGKETYGAGRYLYADAAVDGKVVVDFNRAYNPPCAFTAFATCPLPPKQNWLDVPVEAGEKNYGGTH
jgi:uncharacterized protein (DUF1684 family)